MRWHRGALAATFALAVLAGCGGGTDAPSHDNSITPPTFTPAPAGRAAVGVVQGALVRILSPTAGAGGEAAELGVGATDHLGRFPAIAMANYPGGPLRFEIAPSPEGAARYVCDRFSGCMDEEGAGFAFGEPLPFRIVLAAVTPAAEAANVNVTPFTTAVAQRSEALGGMTAANVEQANREMSQAIEELAAHALLQEVALPDAFYSIPIVDLTAEQADAPPTPAETFVTLLHVALLDLAHDPQQGRAQTLDAVLARLADGFATTGQLPPNGALGSADAVTAADLLLASARLLNGLQAAPANVAERIANLLGFGHAGAVEAFAERLAHLARAYAGVTATTPLEQVDSDRDAATDLIELANGTHPAIADTDDDGVADGRDAFPLAPEEWADADGDGQGNNADMDDDGDGVPDVDDAWPLDNSRSIIHGVFQDHDRFIGYCANPRPADRQGSVGMENLWLRSLSNDIYLWYDEIEDAEPLDYATPAYFRRLRTFALTPAGRLKDRLHYSMPTERWLTLARTSVAPGYGAVFAFVAQSPPREVRIAHVQPESPAAAANLARGATVLEADGVDVAHGSIDAINAALFPGEAGESHRFLVRDGDGVEPRSVTLQAAAVKASPVPRFHVLDTAAGAVGYLLFNHHLATAERALMDAVAALQSAGIEDLVVDLRYNAGGYVAIASQLAYMIAGSAATAGRTFEALRFNRKHRVYDPVTGDLLEPDPFYSRTLGLPTNRPLRPGLPLPSLNLKRVFVLAGGGTCSSSEAFINALRGINFEVLLFGGTTCGQPYGFYPRGNCGTTYFTLQYQAVNDKGFGDYPDGFSPANQRLMAGVPVPGCAVRDDFSHALGDPEEARLAAALAWRETAACPPAARPPDSSMQRASTHRRAQDGIVWKPIWLASRWPTHLPSTQGPHP